MNKFDKQSVKWMVEELKSRGYKVEEPEVDDLDFPVWWIAYDDPNKPYAYPLHHRYAGSEDAPWSHASIWDNHKLVAPVEDVVRYLEDRLDHEEIEKQNWWKQLNDEENANELF
jgi:hypothetical protein